MHGIAALVRQITYEALPKAQRLSYPLWRLLGIWQYLYGLWRGYKICFRQKEGDALCLAAGHVLNTMVGHQAWFRTAAAVLCLADSLSACVETHRKLSQSLQKSWQIASGKWLLYTPYSKQQPHAWVSPSTGAFWRRFYFQAAAWLKAMTFYVGLCFRYLIRLCSYIADCANALIELSTGNRYTGPDIVASGVRCFDKLYKTLAETMAPLKDNSRLVQSILTATKSQITADELFIQAHRAANESRQIPAATPSTVAGDAIKRTWYTFAVALGLHYFVPKHIVPAADPLWWEEEEPKTLGRYAFG